MSNLHSINESVAMHEVGFSPGIGNASDMFIISSIVTASAFANNTDSINTSTAVIDDTMCRFPMTQNFSDYQNSSDEKQAHAIEFYLSVVLSVIAGLISVTGNGLVLYASSVKKDTGRFKYVNCVVRNLAISDLLFGFIGTTSAIVYWYWGK